MSPVTVSLKDKVAIVTGANTGIGLVTARELARAGTRVWVACRSQDKAEAAMAAMRADVPGADLRFLALDLGNLAKTRSAALAFLESGDRLDLLVNNAGLAGSRGTTDDGFEIHFGTNHLGPYLFTRLLVDRLIASAPARIVCVASQGHYRSAGLAFDRLRAPTRTRAGFAEYCDSKLANVLFARALARRLEGTGVTTYALHPGVVASDIWRRVPQPLRWIMLQFMITNEEGARTSLYCATSAEVAGHSGRYYDALREKKAARLARDDALGEELWRQSAQWVGLPA